MPQYSKVVVLDVVEPGFIPDYCVHGKATCMGPGCNEWVWLGDKTFEVVNSGEAMPLCHSCAVKFIPPQPPIGHINDHKRSEGPH